MGNGRGECFDSKKKLRMGIIYTHTHTQTRSLLGDWAKTATG